MSVIFWEIDSLGATIATLVNGDFPRDPKRTRELVDHYAGFLACYSRYNAETYNERYNGNDRATAWTKDEIVENYKASWSRHSTSMAAERAFRFMSLAQYNCKPIKHAGLLDFLWHATITMARIASNRKAELEEANKELYKRLADREAQIKDLAPTKKRSIHPFKVGDVMVCSWGYEQTNVEFARVIKITASNVWLEPLETIIEEERFLAMQGKAVPGEPIKGAEIKHHRAMQNSSDVWYLKNASKRVYWYLWNGKPKACSWYG